MPPFDVEALANRLEILERRHHRLKIGFGGMVLVVVLLAGWSGYRALMDVWQPNVTTQQLSIFDKQPFSFSDAVRARTFGPMPMSDKVQFAGGIGTRRDVRTGVANGADMYFINGMKYRASLGVSEHGPYLALSDSANGIYMGPGRYDNHQLLLELTSRDRKQGFRLGLDGNQQPLFEVIRDGETMSLLDPSLDLSARATSVSH